MINPAPFFERVKNAIVILLLFLFSFTMKAHAQIGDTLSFTLIKKACHNDGILVAHTTIAPPDTFYWNDGGNTNATYSVGSLTGYDTLYNYDGGPVYADGGNSNYFAYGSYKGEGPFVTRFVDSPAICPSPGSAHVYLTGGNPPFTITWYNNGKAFGTGNPIKLPGGFYTFLITDATGCVIPPSTLDSAYYTDSIYIQEISNIRYNVATTTANCTNGTASVGSITGGTPPYSFQWSNGANTDTITGLVTGYYYVTVTDAIGCFTSSYGYVQQSLVISVYTTPTQATCLQNNGSAIAFGSGGKSPYTYLWSTGANTQTVTGLTADDYIVTATDANGCIGEGQAYVTASTPITVTYSTTPSLCTAPTGTATLSISGGTTPYIIEWYTYPAQNGVTATALAEGTYGFHITDAVGCVQSGTVYIPPISPLYGELGESDAECTQANGSASAIVTTGTPPFTYQWNTGGTSAVLSNLATGNYACTITNSQGCSIVKSVSVDSYSPISIGMNSTPASCIFSNDGSITANATNGTPPYLYSWDYGQTVASINNLSPGWYQVYVSDAAGCTAYQGSYVNYNPNNNSCYCTITGTVYDDLNGNCTQDAGEPGIQDIMIECNPFGYTFTDNNGNYSFIVPTGNYTLSEVVQYYYPLASCQNNSINISAVASPGCTSVNNFANVVNPIHDVSITTSSYDFPIPGNTYTQQVFVANNGTVAEPGAIMGYTNDGQLSFGGVTPSLFTQQNSGSYPNWYSVQSGSLSLPVNGWQEFDVTYNVPTNIPLNTQVNFFDSVAYALPMANWLNDYTPWNNVNQYITTVRGSFDPNFKEATPQGQGTQGYILPADSIITYAVHFQNTGNYLAQKVVVVDTLSPNVDFTTLHPGISNHTYSTSVSEKGVVTFTFNNINLPQQGYNNNQASIGYFTYSVHQKHGLTSGTEIKSPASVYFDYNAPVRTNTAINTITFALGVKNVNGESPTSFTLYPNPANGNVTLQINATSASDQGKMSIYNLLGEVVSSRNISLKQGSNTITTDVSTLAAGMYFVEVYDGKYTSVRKLSVAK